MVLLTLYWLLWPYKTLVFKDKFFPVITKNIHPGDVVTYKADYCKYINLPATVSRHIVNGYDYTMPPTLTDRASGCHVIYVSFVLPKETPVGNNYRADMIYKYEVNPLRTIIVQHSTDYFNVIK